MKGPKRKVLGFLTCYNLLFGYRHYDYRKCPTSLANWLHRMVPQFTCENSCIESGASWSICSQWECQRVRILQGLQAVFRLLILFLKLSENRHCLKVRLNKVAVLYLNCSLQSTPNTHRILLTFILNKTNDFLPYVLSFTTHAQFYDVPVKPLFWFSAMLQVYVSIWNIQVLFS